MNRQEWLEARRKGIGSSDAAAVCGLSPWRTPLHVYLDKLGLLPDETSEAMEWGLRLEPVISAAYAERVNHEGYLTLAEPPMAAHPNRPWMLASVDRMAGDRIVELKTARTAEGWGEEGTDEIPEPYLIQVQHQMAVTQLDAADVAVLIGGSDFRVYTARRNEALIERLMEIEERFWRRVEERRPPEPDWSDPDTPKLLDLLHRPEPGKVVDLPESLAYSVNEYLIATEQIRDYEKFRQSEKAHILQAMGSASIGRLSDGREVTRREVMRKGYEVKEATYTTFAIRKGKKDEQRRSCEKSGNIALSLGAEQGAIGGGAAEASDAGADDSRGDHGGTADAGAA